MTIAAAIRVATQMLASISDTARLDAEVLMAHALGVSRSHLLLHHMGNEVPDNFTNMVIRRAAQEPVAYITGSKEFYGLTLHVTRDVLIPRADSETLVEAALAAKPAAARVLDCGTGSGALLLAVLCHLPQAHGTGIDRSEAALAVARTNAGCLGMAKRARMRQADWSAPGWADDLGGPFDLVLANPPYVESDAPLAASVRDHEPAGALFSGPQGLDDYRLLVPQLPGLLATDGVALVEIGATQAEAVSAMARDCRMECRLHLDLGGRPRVLELRTRG